MTPQIKQRIEQIRRGKVPEGYKKTKVGVVPNEWKIAKLASISSHVTKKNTNGKIQTTFTNSATQGVIKQTDYFDKEISNRENISGYYIVQEDDYIYNPRISVSAPCGPINKSHFTESGVVSPLYTVFRMNDGLQKNKYIEYYLKSSFWHRYMCGVANYGARHDRMNITNDDLFGMPILIPHVEDQQKIAEILSAQDKLISLKEKLIEEKKRQKKALMQQLLTGKKRLPGFSGEWKKQRMADVLCERKEENKGQSLRICSVAVNSGVVDQREHLGKSMAASDTSNYNVVHYGDIVYTKSPTGEFPFGIVKQSQLAENVAVSPLYGVYEPATYEIGYLLNEYFMYSNNTNAYLLPIVNKGAKNTINISNSTFITPSLYLPTNFEEIKKLVQIFKIANKEIEILQKDLDQEKQKKKALMQLLLTGIVRVKT